MVTVIFDTTQYEAAHCKAPRGFGSWAFDWGQGVRFAPTSTYGAAKAWATEQVKAVAKAARVSGPYYVEVCS